MKSKDITPVLCVATGFFSFLSYIVTFSVAWGFFDQGYPNGVQVRNAALVSTVQYFVGAVKKFVRAGCAPPSIKSWIHPC